MPYFAVPQEASPWIEWYYRSVLPGVHYAAFTDETDIIQVGV